MVGLLHPYLGIEDFCLLESQKQKEVDNKRAYLGEIDRHDGLLHHLEASTVFY